MDHLACTAVPFSCPNMGSLSSSPLQGRLVPRMTNLAAVCSRPTSRSLRQLIDRLPHGPQTGGSDLGRYRPSRPDGDPGDGDADYVWRVRRIRRDLVHGVRPRSDPGQLSQGVRRVCPTPCQVGHTPTWAARPDDDAAGVARGALKDGHRRDLESVPGRMLSDGWLQGWSKTHVVGQCWPQGTGRRGCSTSVVALCLRRLEQAPRQPLTPAAVRQRARSNRGLIILPALRLRRRVDDQAGLGPQATRHQR
jgi:hypothetical protein